MSIIGFLFALGFTLIAITLDAIAEAEHLNWSKWIFILGICSGMSFIFGYIGNRPTPLDVYRNKTTLQITYQDSIPVDSIVVFKNN